MSPAEETSTHNLTSAGEISHCLISAVSRSRCRAGGDIVLHGGLRRQPQLRLPRPSQIRRLAAATCSLVLVLFARVSCIV